MSFINMDISALMDNGITVSKVLYEVFIGEVI